VHIEDDLNILANGRQPLHFGEWKTTSILFQMEDDLNIFFNGRRPNEVGEKLAVNKTMVTKKPNYYGWRHEQIRTNRGLPNPSWAFVLTNNKCNL
jgi:hypothetical protein